MRRRTRAPWAPSDAGCGNRGPRRKNTYMIRGGIVMMTTSAKSP